MIRNNKTLRSNHSQGKFWYLCFSGLVSIWASVTPDQKRIPRNNKRKETPSVLIQREEPIQETVNIRKISKEGYLMYSEKESQHKMYQSFWHRADYEGYINKTNWNTDDSWPENEIFVKTWRRTRL